MRLRKVAKNGIFAAGPLLQVQTAIFIWENRGNGSIKVRLDVLAKTSQWGVVGVKSP